MGCILSTPVELIRVQRHGSAAFRCAVAEMQGWRVHHEDAHEMHCTADGASFWVLDGHGGDGAALYGAPALNRELGTALAESEGLPADERVEQGFLAVDTRLREYVKENPEKDSGTTVVGALARRHRDGTYSMKLMNCGDSRGLILRGPTEQESAVPRLPVRIPEHLELLKARAQEPSVQMAASESGLFPETRWPIVAESVDHKPSHPTERSRIEAAGGCVSEDDPPRLDGNLAVSRGLGDFEYKSDSSRTAAAQKVSCVPDIYEVEKLPPGTVCILACDGIWDVMTGDAAAAFVREWLQREPKADLGEIAAELIRTSLRKNSRDNMTAMIIHFVDGSDWENVPDEMKNYEKLREQADDEEARKHYLAFLRKSKFSTEPRPCDVCRRWTASMMMCPCEGATYCSRACQKKDFKAHKPHCAMVAAALAKAE